MKNDGVVVPELLGLNRASTFTGFCSRHDDAIFRPVEKQTFSCSQEQCFLLGYRALAREIYTKKAAASLIDMHRNADKGKLPHEQEYIQDYISKFESGQNAALRDNDHYKTIYDNMLLERDFSCVRSYVIELAEPPVVMCSGGFFPTQDFEDCELQDLTDLGQIPHLLNCTSFYGGHHGAVVFTWLPESDSTCIRFIKSLHRVPDEALTGALLRFFFKHFENVHIKPDWWENLPEQNRETLILHMAESADTEVALQKQNLADDGIYFSPWQVIQRIIIEFEI